MDTHGKAAARDALLERYTEASMVDLDVDPDSEGGFIFDADLDDMTARFEITEYGHEPRHYLLRRRDNGSWRMKYTTETAERLIAERAERWETRPQFVHDKLGESAEEDLPAFRVSTRKWQRLGAEQEHELERCWRVREELRPLIRR